MMGLTFDKTLHKPFILGSYVTHSVILVSPHPIALFVTLTEYSSERQEEEESDEDQVDGPWTRPNSLATLCHLILSHSVCF
jgi:hypothetical protein